MKIYALHVDPETGMIDPEADLSIFRVEKETEETYLLYNGRKILKSSALYQFYPTRDAAEKEKVNLLMYLRRYYIEKLRVVNNKLMRSKYHRWGEGRRPTLIRMIRPDGSVELCTRNKAAEVSGMVLGSITRLLKNGEKSKNGYSFEYIDIKDL